MAKWQKFPRWAKWGMIGVAFVVIAGLGAAIEESGEPTGGRQEEDTRISSNEENTLRAEVKTPPPTEHPACPAFSGPDDRACELSYTLCTHNAETIVKDHYTETGPDLNQYAETYAAKEYGASGSSEEAAYSGCLGALLDEYNALYR